MKILFIYPEYPDTFWSYKHAVKFVSRKAAYPPLGLLTVSSLLPAEWQKKLIDLNVEKLRKKDIQWADYVFIGAMGTQIKSATEAINECKSMGKPIVAGGPLFTEDHEKFEQVDHMVLNEAEITLPQFLEDLQNGAPKKMYTTGEFADITALPAPDYSLINLKNYSTMSIQYTRGCPFDCEFCDITALLGRKMRMKTTEQIITELQVLYDAGWSDGVFFVDDNFIGNKKTLKNDLLPLLIDWMKKHNYPFNFITEASVNLSDDPQLMEMMTAAGFSSVFVGIETPQENSLEECNKTQNKNRNLIESVKTIQQQGMEVMGGFIVGFDSDTPGIFRQQIDFIQNSGIISAMIGLLNAPTKSKLYQRMKKEGRILNKMTGDNTDATMNFVPKMDPKVLSAGYREIISGIYDGKPFYRRVRRFLNDFQPKVIINSKLKPAKIMALFKSMVVIGIIDSNRKYYWNLFFWSLFNRPKVFPLAITYSIYGYHYRRVFKKMNSN